MGITDSPYPTWGESECINWSFSLAYIQNSDPQTVFNPLSLFRTSKTRLIRSPCCLCVWVHLPSTFEWLSHLYETRYVYHGTWASHQYKCLYLYSHIVARQRLGKNFTVATNTHVTIEQLSESFSVLPVPYQKKVGDQFFLSFLVTPLCPNVAAHWKSQVCCECLLRTIQTPK
jgi:hypothetical protein